MAQESEARESFEQLEMLKRTHDKLRTRAEELEGANDKLFNELEIVKKTLKASTPSRALRVLCVIDWFDNGLPLGVDLCCHGV